VIPVKIDRDKETRASAVTGYFESGRVLFPEGAAWLADLEDELASFPGGLHDDCVDAISQALNRLRDSGGELGLLELFKRIAKEIEVGIRDDFGELFHKPQREPRPVLLPAPAAIVTSVRKKKVNDPCPACGNTATVLQSDGNGREVLHCNQCGRNDGKNILTELGCARGCPAFLKQVVAGRVKCGNCGNYHDPSPAIIGMSRGQYERLRGCNRFQR
jgi:transcription elongation factor Elf1